MKEPICTLEQVEKEYGRGSVSLGPLSFDLYPGEVLGLRGPNGAGKSTALKVLAGLIRPDRGRCIRHGDLTGRVGYVPQEIALYGTLSGLDNLGFWGAVGGLPRKAAKIRSRWLLDQLDLTEKGRTPVSAYSGGMRRRLHLATALMVTPRLLLLDEPTVGADPHSAELILKCIERVRSQGCAVVLVSHQTGELERVCDRILCLEGGQVAREEVLR